MNFPSLLNTLLYQDNYVSAVAEKTRLERLASCNGTNATLQLYISYIEKTGQSPTPDSLKSHAATNIGIEAVEEDLETAALYHAESPNEPFALALVEAEDAAKKDYISRGYAIAQALNSGILPKDDKYNFKRELTKLYGDDKQKWNWGEYSQQWLINYLGENPFTNLTPLVGTVLATGMVEDEDGLLRSATLVGTPVEMLESLPTDWLWEDKIPAGTICWWAGKGGCGKSASLCDLVARVSAGLPFPDGKPNSGPRKILFGSSEDDWNKTLRPRLEAAGANLKNIMRLDGVVTSDGLKSLFNLKANLPLLVKHLQSDPDVGLVCLDAISSYWGDVNSNAEGEMKPLMDALKDALEKTKTTFLGIIHNNKRSDADALGKVMGAGCVANSARAVFAFGFDPEDETKQQRMMSLVKCNLTKSMSGLYYTIEDHRQGNISAARVIWGDKHDNTADDVMKAEADKKYQRKETKQVDKAQEFLRASLSNGAKKATEIFEEALNLGISDAAVYRAKEKLGVINYREKQTQRSIWTLGREESIIPEDAA